MGLPARERLVALGGHRGRPPSARRGDARVTRPSPRVDDRRTQPVDHTFADELLPRSPHLTSAEIGRRTRVDGQPWIPGHGSLLCPEPHRESARRVEGLQPPSELAGGPEPTGGPGPGHEGTGPRAVEAAA